MSAVDPVSVEVVGNYLVSAVREMNTTLRRTAYSTILRESMDCSTALFDGDGQMIGQADHVPSHQGSLALAARSIATTMELDPGDVVILNHPYQGGTHHPDIMIFKPVFHDGNRVAIAAALGHHIDVGGRSPGSISSDARDVYEEGLMIPALKLYRRGELVPEILSMIEANIRVPEKTLGDIRAEIAAVTIGERRYIELIERYGATQLQHIVAGVLDESERLMREDLAALPDGRYFAEGFLDSDGIDDRPVRIAVTVEVEGDGVCVDFTGSSPQVRGPFNCSPSSVYSAVYAGVRYMTNPIIRQNEGCFRPIRLLRPEGSIVNPRRPAPISGRFTTLERIADTIVLALNAARGEDQVASGVASVCSFAANGVDPGTGRGFVCFEIFGGGWGGSARCDGLDASFGLMANCLDTPIEAVEMEYPLRVENYNLITDSGGAGRHRGGLGFHRDTRYLHGEGYFTNRSETSLFPPKGVLGGQPGAPSRQRLLRADGQVQPLPSKITNVHIQAGDLIEMAQPGGGGCGDPLDRDPQAVLEDLLDEKISARAALEIYGVVVIYGQVDHEATARRRAAGA
jgi:N-methylhydantoinase B